MATIQKKVINESSVRMIFGLKLRQLRIDKGLLLTDLAGKTGISMSYLNEIEKGKKFPKADKIAALADALEVSYDWLISLQMNKNLAPVAKLLQSTILHELPLEVFGIDKSQLLDLLSSAPVKLNAFLSTLVEISRNYGMRMEHFYFSALRSYQEMQENYFEDIEKIVDQFVGKHQLDVTRPMEVSKLMELLESEYHYQIDEDGLTAQPELQELRSVLLPGKTPRLLLNKNLSDTQKAFILAREIGFNFMDITERSTTTSWVEITSFEQVLNNFKGSYFSCALLLNKQILIEQLTSFFNNRKFNRDALLELMQDYAVSPEVFTHRLTNLLPRFFGIQELFFLRFSNNPDSQEVELTKEMHLSGLHNPHTSMMHEHYCHRWVSITILQDLAKQQKEGTYDQPLCRAQRSKYIGTDKEYLIISFAKPSMKGSRTNNSISVGLLLTEQLKRKVKFWNDPAIPIRMVGETCERCPASDCAERKEQPLEIIKSQRVGNLKIALSALAEE
jgi:predicted transcriptional regulator/DNA-binding Xre family transcriptional regulator